MVFPTDRLYKFASFNENSLSALADQTVWFSDLDSLNDPFEVSVRYEVPKEECDKIVQYINAAAIDRKKVLNISEAEALELANKTYQQDPKGFCEKFELAIEHVKNEHSDLLNSLNIFSTSLDLPDDVPHSENILMWSHYGVGFTGFCLQFSASNFLNSTKELNPDSKIGYCKVDYVTESHVVNPVDYVPFVNEQYFSAMQFKHEQWKYEGELRFISGTRGLHHYSPDALDNVYIGFKMPINKRKVLIAIIRQYFPNTKIYLTEIDKASYKIVAKKI
ncbi:DUF2971 domain-containing protein [Pseudoalteromonas sp. NEC-BIFX-2020_015]|uniref:DUF2971 domain-containing protein n=1 Tax=Pseudoalteromonas sp. NEC-BIFX-2020_015 TaxID=2729544 RepID=UPI0014613772|nr:DUF2971 domain-containing protein [Pseudoalteromonas sp. NEC-BIFX-2020_015]NMR26651.1 DUF2971 domain-containing protein [Pseudoalteromonas sp. NEC-BIFX-2020_015]